MATVSDSLFPQTLNNVGTGFSRFQGGLKPRPHVPPPQHTSPSARRPLSNDDRGKRQRYGAGSASNASRRAASVASERRVGV